MPRKAILSGGKRDEIIDIATKLFFTEGYEATSVRAILNQVDGEVGMFYHYFKSKEDLFQKVVEKFFADYKVGFRNMAMSCESKDALISNLLQYYLAATTNFMQVSGAMHWSIQYALAAKTIQELVPVFEELIEKWGYHGKRNSDIVAGQLLGGIAATLHSESYPCMSMNEQRDCIEELVNRILKE